MDKVGRPRGLVRYDSLNGLEGRPQHVARPRLYFYGGIAALWLLGTVLAFAHTTDFEANVLRHQGAPFAVVDGEVRNSLKIHLINKSAHAETFLIEASPDDSSIEYVIPRERIELDSLGSTYVPILAMLPADQIQPGLKVRVRIAVEGEDGGGESSRVVEAPFVGPGT